MCESIHWKMFDKFLANKYFASVFRSLSPSFENSPFIYIFHSGGLTRIYRYVYKQAQAHTFMRVKSKYSIECSVSFRMLYGDDVCRFFRSSRLNSHLNL